MGQFSQLAFVACVNDGIGSNWSNGGNVKQVAACGGVDLKEVNISSMESRLIPNLFFAGEVLNIDGETGGFNFQAAWSTAFAAATSIARSVG